MNTVMNDLEDTIKGYNYVGRCATVSISSKALFLVLYFVMRSRRYCIVSCVELIL